MFTLPTYSVVISGGETENQNSGTHKLPDMRYNYYIYFLCSINNKTPTAPRKILKTCRIQYRFWSSDNPYTIALALWNKEEPHHFMIDLLSLKYTRNPTHRAHAVYNIKMS